MIFIILIIAITFGYTVFVGYNDGANAIATSIATRAISYRTALITAVVSTVAAPIIFYLIGAELSVADTIGRTVQNSVIAGEKNELAFSFLFSGVLGSLLWCLFSAKIKLPVSTSHSLLGGISGAGVAAFGILPIDWNSIIIKIIFTAVAAPLVGFFVGYAIMKIVKRIAYKVPLSSEGIIKKLQTVNIAILSSAISINNIQKPLGVMILLFAASESTFAGDNAFLIILFSALALAFGACLGGTRIIHTVGKKIFKIKPVHSFLTQISVEAVIFAASSFGIPISAGQAVSSTVMGVGAADRFGSVNWSNSLKIFIFWVLTYPITFAIGATLYFILKIFFK
ncbi:MAG: inorganic phosphate transporter [Clostridiales bacterium]|jgi:PiT family inorganic phosphate transporter|nr:inorganic phosphate transporter [Clostridiales bacterium]